MVQTASGGGPREVCGYEEEYDDDWVDYGVYKGWGNGGWDEGLLGNGDILVKSYLNFVVLGSLVKANMMLQYCPMCPWLFIPYDIQNMI